MITQTTVLILGAGASKPYGFPTGAELRDKVLRLGDAEPFYGMCNMFGHERDVVMSFIHAFRMSATNSIDAFLEYRSEFMDIGKIAITLILTECEREPELHSGSGDWYRYLFGKLSTNFEDFSKNQLSILTFNYDRSLEQFLFTALKNLYGKSDEECIKAVETIPIIHLHGKIGNLPWQGGDRPYEGYDVLSFSQNGSAATWLAEGIEGIKILHEGSVKPSTEFSKAHRLLSKAKRIYFLGFGYHPINIKRLRVDRLDKLQLKQATGTVYGLTPVECEAIERNLLADRFDLHQTNARHQSILDFLREHVIL